MIHHVIVTAVDTASIRTFFQFAQNIRLRVFSFRYMTVRYFDARPDETYDFSAYYGECNFHGGADLNIVGDLSLRIVSTLRYVSQRVHPLHLFYRRNFVTFVRLKEEMMEFTLTEEYIELIRLLKITRIAESGGQAKLMVDNGDVWRNGIQEYRKRAKICGGKVLILPP